MTQEIDRKNVKICLDVPLFSDRQKTEYVREAVEKCKDYILYTHYGAWNLKENENGEVEQEPAPTHGGKINYETFLEGLHTIGYRGYLASEYCLPMIRNHKIAGIEEVDKATVRGLKYMKKLVAETAISSKRSSSPKVSLV
jgi:sugar phosphate isomerase/epimerase